MHFKKNLLKFYSKIASYNNISDIILQRHFRWKKKLPPTTIFLILFYNDISDEKKK